MDTICSSRSATKKRPPAKKKDSVIVAKKAKAIMNPYSDEAPSLENISDHIFMCHILPFLGEKQYRFVGAVNRRFRISYFSVFSATTSYEHVTTVEQAMLCRMELSLQQRLALCKVAIKKGLSNVVKLLFESIFYNRYETCDEAQLTATAAECGDFELLRWLVRNNCRVDQTIFSGAAIHGDLAMFQWLYALPCFEMETDDDSHNSDSSFDSSQQYVPWNTDIYDNAASHGHLPIIEWAYSKERCVPRAGKMCSSAIQNGHLDVLKWAYSLGFSMDDPSLCVWAAKNGHLDVLMWLRSIDCPWNAWVCSFVAASGHVEIVQWLHMNGCPWDELTLYKAFAARHFEVVEWAKLHGCPLFSLDSLCDTIADYGDIEMVNIANTVLGFPLSPEICRSAIFRGDLDLLQWLHKNHCPCDPRACRTAAEQGHFEVLKWLYSIGCELDSETMEFAVLSGCMNILQWLYDHGCPWGKTTCATAAECGRVFVLKWLRDNGCPWDWTTYKSALLSDSQHITVNLHILEWAYTNGCPPSNKICSIAAQYGYLDVLQWARGHDIPWSNNVCFLAAKNKDVEMLDWALANGCPWPDLYESLSNTWRGNQRDLLNWFVTNGVGLNADTCARAALEGDFKFFQWLHHNACPWDERSCVNAAEMGHDDVLAFALENGCPSEPNREEVPVALLESLHVSDSAMDLN
jgi:hypothetical protein